MMIAVSSGFTEIVELLLQKGANVNAQNENGQTCMHYVASRNRQRVRSIVFEDLLLTLHCAHVPFA